MSDDMVESIQEELTCAICFDIFDNPVIIGSCTHTFCKECITKSISSTGRSVTCPLCRKVYKMTNEQFKRNIYVQNIIEKMREKGVIPKEPEQKEKKIETKNTNDKISSGFSYSGFGSNIISNLNSSLFDRPGSNIL